MRKRFGRVDLTLPPERTVFPAAVIDSRSPLCVPSDTYMGSLGNWYAYTAVLPEAEERRPWQPLHVQKGFKPTASIFFGGWYTHAGSSISATTPRRS
jgi:hypothetical protein